MLNLPRNSCCWRLAGTETLRLSSSAWLEEYGTNLTNIEKGMRKMYWADEGKVLVQVDQAGAEALIVAYLCREGRFRQLFENNVKPHVFVAMNVFLEEWQKRCPTLDLQQFRNASIPDLKKLPGWKALDTIIKESDNWESSLRFYFFAKQMCHSLNYGCKEEAFRMNVLEKSKGRVVLSRNQARDYISSYHSLFPEIQEWHGWVVRQLKETKMLFNLFGYPRQLTGVLDERDAKEWFAFCPQSTVGCITHKAITLMNKFIRMEGVDWDILINGHDSMLCQCPIGEEKYLGQTMTTFICQELMSPHGVKFKMRSEAQFGLNWGPYKKIENEDGLRELQLN